MLLICIGLALFLIIAFYIFDNDFFSTSFLVLAGYFVSSLFAMYSSEKWGTDIHWILIVILFSGWSAFVFGEIFIKRILYKNHWHNNELVEFQKITFQPIVLILLIGLNIIITLFLYREVSRIANIGGNSLSNGLIAGYKENALDNSISGFVTQLLKITKGTAYVCAAIFCNNIIFLRNRKETLKQSILLVPGLIYCTQCIMKGGRFNVIAYLIAILFYSIFVLQYSHGWKYKMPVKSLLKIVFAALFIVYAFWFYKEFVGRTSEALFGDYIAQYVGGPYELFNQFVKENSNTVGTNETFAGLVESINKILGTSIKNLSYHEFRFTATGIMLGNAYSGMRNYYSDFGIFGVVIICFLYSAFFSKMYCRLAKSNNIYSMFFCFIYLGSIVYCLVFHFFSDYFLARISVGYFIEVFVMYIVYRIIVKTRFKI